MTCQELADFIIDYVENKLPADRREVFEKHLAVCPSCIEYLNSYKSTCQILGDLRCDGEEEVPCEVPDDLVSAILAARKGEEPSSPASEDDSAS
ncbi:MAG: zf-HC2 domain-containing protein [Planctomycetota bacterium]